MQHLGKDGDELYHKIIFGMSNISKVQLIHRHLIKDERGWFFKAITGCEEGIPLHTGEVYLTMGIQGQIKGGHYHPEAVEWFTVIEGEAILRLEDIFLRSRNIYWMEEWDNLQTLLCHAFQGILQQPVRFRHDVAYGHEEIPDQDSE